MSYNNSKFNGRKGNSNKNSNQQNNFFNCHLNAVGYINSLRECEGQSGPFLVAQFCALEGRSDAPTHRYYSLTLTEKMAELLCQFWDEINGEQKCFANLRIGNTEYTPFQYPQDHANYPGQLGVNCTGKLLSIQSLSIDKQKVDLGQFEPAQQQPYQKQQAPQGKGYQQQAQNHAPQYANEFASGEWEEQPVHAQPAPAARQAVPNPGRAPAQNGYQRQPQGRPHGQAPRTNGAGQRGYQGQQRSH